MTPRNWLRTGLLLLVVLQTIIAAWQYFAPLSFYTNFPTVALDPPYNEHLLSDVGGLGLAITVVTVCAAVWLEYRLVCAALLGFIVYALTHLAFHLTHFDGFSTGEAVEVGVGLAVYAVIPIVLLALARHVHRAAAA
jgi:hypothetical protein